MTGVY